VNERPRRSRVGAVRTEALSAARNSGRHRPDYWILILTALLLTLGLIVVYSISPGLAASQKISQNYFITKQLIAVAFGLVTFWLASTVSLDFWRKAVKPLAAIALVGCLIVMVTPINAQYPAHRWIRAGGFSFQIAELIKLALIVYLAGFLGDHWRKGTLNDTAKVLQPLLIGLLALSFVVAKLQSDLGSAGVMIIIMGAMAFTAGVPLRRIAMFGGIVLVILGLAIASSGYRRERLNTFLHPESNCQSSGYQECQALISVGSGGLFGLGLGYSVQAYGYLPEASNDSIFAIIAEKFGFVGTLTILVVYGVFISRLKMVIERTSDPFKRLLVVGVMAWLSTQLIINVGAMTGLLPLKGITLPLISQGGTSLIFITAALGIVFQVSRYTNYKVTEPDVAANEITRTPNHSLNGRRLRGAYNPSVVTRPRT
jgi:cell division protein FtsW